MDVRNAACSETATLAGRPRSCSWPWISRRKRARPAPQNTPRRSNACGEPSHNAVGARHLPGCLAPEASHYPFSARSNIICTRGAISAGFGCSPSISSRLSYSSSIAPSTSGRRGIAFDAAGQAADQRVMPVQFQDLRRRLVVLLDHAAHPLHLALEAGVRRDEPRRAVDQQLRLAHLRHPVAQHRLEPGDDLRPVRVGQRLGLRRSAPPARRAASRPGSSTFLNALPSNSRTACIM